MNKQFYLITAGVYKGQIAMDSAWGNHALYIPAVGKSLYKSILKYMPISRDELTNAMIEINAHREWVNQSATE